MGVPPTIIVLLIKYYQIENLAARVPKILQTKNWFPKTSAVVKKTSSFKDLYTKACIFEVLHNFSFLYFHQISKMSVTEKPVPKKLWIVLVKSLDGVLLLKYFLKHFAIVFFSLQLPENDKTSHICRLRWFPLNWGVPEIICNFFQFVFLILDIFAYMIITLLIISISETNEKTPPIWIDK